MRKLLLIPIFALLCACAPTSMERTRQNDGRFSFEAQNFGGNIAFLITDKKTGREYLCVHCGYGTAITELNK